jgi:uncharacterized protein
MSVRCLHPLRSGGVVSDDDRSPVAGTEVHYLSSRHVGDEFKIFIGHCGDPGDKPRPVLYVGDGNGIFAGAVEVVRFMQLSAHLPPLLVVGIGYRMGALAETVAVRTRDFTPTVDRRFSGLFPAQAMMGGASRFLAFIRDELQPWVQGRFHATGDAAFFGHSMGGLFATYALLSDASPFQRYGIASPSLWWDNDVMFDVEQRYANAHDDLPAKVFVSIGEYEDHEGRQREASRLPETERANANARYIDMVADTRRMVAALRDRNYPGLQLGDVVLPGEFHITSPHLSLSRALRHLYDAPA